MKNKIFGSDDERLKKREKDTVSTLVGAERRILHGKEFIGHCWSFFILKKSKLHAEPMKNLPPSSKAVVCTGIIRRSRSVVWVSSQSTQRSHRCESGLSHE